MLNKVHSNMVNVRVVAQNICTANSLEQAFRNSKHLAAWIWWSTKKVV